MLHCKFPPIVGAGPPWNRRYSVTLPIGTYVYSDNRIIVIRTETIVTANKKEFIYERLYDMSVVYTGPK